MTSSKNAAREKVLPQSFYARDTLEVAQELLGKILVRIIRGKKLSGRITEVEAYIGENDLACHAARGRTARTERLYSAAGHAYIYLIYGMYYCFNVVTEQKEFPAAVLIRSLQPLEGSSSMHAARKTNTESNLTTGPGKLTQALSITNTLQQENLWKSTRLTIVDDGYRIANKNIGKTARIGVDYAGPCALYPWRFYLKNSEYISRK